MMKLLEQIEKLSTKKCMSEFLGRFESEFWHEIHSCNRMSKKTCINYIKGCKWQVLDNSFKKEIQQIFHKHTSVFRGACKNCGGSCDLLSRYPYLISFFDEHTAYEVMLNALQEKLFLFFGFHPVIQKYDHLQIRWLNTSAQHTGVNYSIMLPNITDNAIRAVDPIVAYNFLSFGFHGLMTNNISLFLKTVKKIKLDTIERLIFIRLLSDGKTKDYDDFMIEFLKRKS